MILIDFDLILTAKANKKQAKAGRPSRHKVGEWVGPSPGDEYHFFYEKIKPVVCCYVVSIFIFIKVVNENLNHGPTLSVS